MKIAITGGNGRFGRVLIKHLAQQESQSNQPKYQLICIDQTQTLPAGYVHPDGVTMFADTLQDRTVVPRLFEGCDAVVHLAANASPMNNPPEQVYANNTVSSYHVLLAAADLGIKKSVWPPASMQLVGRGVG